MLRLQEGLCSLQILKGILTWYCYNSDSIVINSGDGCPWPHPRQGKNYFFFSRLRSSGSAYPVPFTAGPGSNLLASKTVGEWICSLHRVSRLRMRWRVCIPIDIRTQLNAIKGWHHFTFNFTICVKSLLLTLHCIFLYRILNLCIYVLYLTRRKFWHPLIHDRESSKWYFHR